MNITFLIGNGFDINAGFQTRYTNFIDAYIKNQNGAVEILDFKKLISKNKESWADAEIALGEVTEKYKSAEVFLKCYQDFCVSLSKYLKKQEELADYSDEKLKLNMTQALVRFPSFLTETQKIKTDYLFRRIGGSHNYNFINFNYTRIFDSCVKILPNADRSFYSYRSSDISYNCNLGQLIHIHGDLSSPMLLGVNDETQVFNKEFLKNRKFLRQFIKPLTNEGLQTLKDEAAKKIISESHLICVYGMSLGATDKLWWQNIIVWLKESDYHYLVIYTLADNYNENLSSSFLDTEEDVQNKLFLYAELTDEAKESLRKKIFVAINKPLFNFKLANKQENTEAQKSA